MFRVIKIKPRKRGKQFEGYWQMTFYTLAPLGLNSINQLKANLVHQCRLENLNILKISLLFEKFTNFTGK